MNDRISVFYHICICSVCGKRFSFAEEEQEPGFRVMDELRCPYCKTVLAQSMEVEYLFVEGLEVEKNGKKRKKNLNRSK